MNKKNLSMLWLITAVLIAAVSNTCFSAGNVIKAGIPADEPPRWAYLELLNFEKAETNLQEFLKRFTGPEGNTLGGENAGHGAIDDRMEGLFRWDRFLVLGASDDLKEQFLRVWKWCWKYGVERGIFRKGFYRGSYDAEHGCELFPMLWACIELFPDDEEIIRTNRRLADMLCSPVYFHPELHFLRYSAMNAMLTAETAPRAMRKARGDNAGNTMYTTAPWLAYLTTGDEKYRMWVLNYAKAWNRAAKMNNGILPFGVDTATGSIKFGPNGNGEWWKANAGFDYEEYGITIAAGGFQKLFTAAAYLDSGKKDYASGLVSTLKAMAEKADKNHVLPGGYSPEKGGWFISRHGTSQVPILLQRVYTITWDSTIRKMITDYPDWKTIKWCKFIYNAEHDSAWLESVVNGGIKSSRLRKGIIRTATGQQPRGGDSQRESSPLPARYNFDIIDGGLWGAGYNGRIGGPSTSEVGYFDEHRQRSLPSGVAAYVRNADKGSVTVVLYNSRSEPVRIIITGGYYGQHRIDSVKTGDGSKKVNQRKLVLELASRGLAEVKLSLSRCVYIPSLKPQSDRPEKW